MADWLMIVEKYAYYSIYIVKCLTDNLHVRLIFYLGKKSKFP